MSALPRRGWRRVRHSLVARLTLLFLLLALAMALTFMAGMQAALRFGWQDYARPLIADYVDTLVAEIGTPPNVAKARALAQRLPLRIRIEGPVVNWSSQPANAHDAWRLQHHGEPWSTTRTLADGHRISFGLSRRSETPAPLRSAGDSCAGLLCTAAEVLRSGPSAALHDTAPEERPRLIGWATLAALLLLIALAYGLVRRLLRPLSDIRAGAVRYGRGDFSQPIPTRQRDELGDLAQQINGMADGLHHMLDAKRQLLLAISHELRSPLTRARLNAELVGEGGARDALLHDLAQMRDLITDLLESERLAAGHAALHTEPVDLNALVRGLIATSFHGRGVGVALDAGLPTLALDPTRIKLLLRNLIDNALRHAVEATTPPLVSTRLDAGHVLLTVRDHGPGVDDTHLAHLADAFYRADAARQRATGGVGLGLYLCRLVSQAHGGKLAVRAAHPGLAVEVSLPTGE